MFSSQSEVINEDNDTFDAAIIDGQSKFPQRISNILLIDTILSSIQNKSQPFVLNSSYRWIDDLEPEFPQEMDDLGLPIKFTRKDSFFFSGKRGYNSQSQDRPCKTMAVKLNGVNGATDAKFIPVKDTPHPSVPCQQDLDDSMAKDNGEKYSGDIYKVDWTNDCFLDIEPLEMIFKDDSHKFAFFTNRDDDGDTSPLTDTSSPSVIN